MAETKAVQKTGYQELANALGNAYVVLFQYPNDMKKQNQAAQGLYQKLDSLPQNDSIRQDPNFKSAMSALRDGDLRAGLRDLAMVSSQPKIHYLKTPREQIANALSNAYAVLLNDPNDKSRQKQAAQELYEALGTIAVNDPIKSDPHYDAAITELRKGNLRAGLKELVSINLTLSAAPKRVP